MNSCIVFHCQDLKPGNILVDSEGNCRIANFGHSRRMLESQALASTVCGTRAYMAPEIIYSGTDDASYDWACDIFSFGVIAHEFAFGLSPSRIQQETVAEKIGATTSRLLGEMGLHASQVAKVKALMDQTLVVDAKERSPAKKVKEMLEQSNAGSLSASSQQLIELAQRSGFVPLSQRQSLAPTVVELDRLVTRLTPSFFPGQGVKGAVVHQAWGEDEGVAVRVWSGEEAARVEELATALVSALRDDVADFQVDEAFAEQLLSTIAASNVHFHLVQQAIFEELVSRAEAAAIDDLRQRIAACFLLSVHWGI